MAVRTLVMIGAVVSASAALAADAIVPADPQLGRPADFNLDIYPVLESKCLACHSRTVHEGDLVLESVETILKGGGSGAAVVAGKPDESLLFKVCARLEEPFMPPQPNKAAAMPLTPGELGLFKQWITEGAQPGKANPASQSLAWQTVPQGLKAVFGLALSPDERFIAAGRANRIVIYDVTARQEVAQLADPAIRSVQGPNGSPLYETGVAHLDFVHALAFSPDGNWLASSGYREIKLWERQHDVKLLTQPLGAAAVAAAVSPDGTLAALVLNNNTVRLWNLASGQPGTTIQGFPAAATCAVFLPGGQSVLTGCDDGILRLSKTADGQLAIEWPTGQPVKAVAVTADGKTAITGHADGALRLWSIPEAAPASAPAPLKEIAGHGGAILAIQLRAGANEVVTGCADGQIRRVNLDNGQVEFANGPGGPVTAAAITPSGEFLAAAASSGNLAKIWKRDGQQVAELKGDPAFSAKAVDVTDESVVAKAQQELADAAVKQSEKDVTEREDSLKKAQEAKTKAEQAVAEPQKKVEEAQQKLKAAQEALAQKTDDEGLKKQVTEAEAAVKKEEDALQKAKDAVTSADRAIVLSQQSIDVAKKAVEDRKAQLTAAQQRSQQVEEQLKAAKEAVGQSPRPVGAVAVSPDSRQFATAGDDGLIHLWDAATGKWLETLHGHGGPVRALAYTAAGALLSAGDDQQLIAWDVKPEWKLQAVLGGKPDNTIDISESPMVDRVLCLAFSPDSAKLASGGGDPSRSGEIVLWDVATRAPLRVTTDLHSDTVFGLEFSRDGSRIASCGADKFVKVSEAASGKLLRAYEGHTSHVLGVSWKQDGSSLASCGADNAIKIWNVETGEQRRTISNYAKQVTSIGYVGVTDNLVSSSGDTNVKFHNAGNGGNYRTFGGSTDYVYNALASRDESLVVAAGEDGVIRVWNGKNGQVLATFDPPSASAPAESSTAAR